MVKNTYPPRTGDWTKAKPVDACWIDGHWGIYGLPRMIDIAIEHGLPDLGEDECALLSAYEDGEGYDPDEFYSLADEVEEWMNAWLAPDGYSFGWYEGEFFLLSNDNWLATADGNLLD